MLQLWLYKKNQTYESFCHSSSLRSANNGERARKKDRYALKSDVRRLWEKSCDYPSRSSGQWAPFQQSWKEQLKSIASKRNNCEQDCWELRNTLEEKYLTNSYMPESSESKTFGKNIWWMWALVVEANPPNYILAIFAKRIGHTFLKTFRRL